MDLPIPTHLKDILFPIGDENSGPKRYSYSLDSAGITYTDQQGIEHNFVSEFYNKTLHKPY